MNFTGIKFKEHRNTDIKDIAALIRSEIKKTFPGVKTSVRIERYSMGQSLNIWIVSTPFKIYTPDYIEKYKHGSNDLSKPDKYTPEGSRILNEIESIANQYNYDNCDSMTDYFDVNFYLHVQYNYNLIDQEAANETANK